MPDLVRLETLTAEDFAPHIGSLFQLEIADSETLPLTLREVTPIGTENPSRRRPFSLLFAGSKIPPLPQQIYSLTHAPLGTLEIFLVPIRETASERDYEAIFA